MYIIFDILRKRRKKYLTSILRGYKYLKKTNSLNKIHNYKKNLTNIKIKINKNKFDDFLFLNEKYINNEIIFRQYLLNKFLNSYFNQNILSYFGSKSFSSLNFGYPVEWLNYLSREGIKINYIHSKIIWRIKIIKNFLLTFNYFFKIIKNTFSSKLEICSLVNTIYVEGTSVPKNLIQKSSKGYTFINWLIEYFNKLNKKKHSLIIEPLVHIHNHEDLQRKNIYSNKYITSLDKRNSIYNLIFWFSKATVISIFDILFARGFRAYLLKESLKTKVYHLNFESNSPRYALFSCSEWIYRPLWTYLAESLGTEIIFFFYSTNLFQLYNLKNETFRENIKYGWESITWSNFFVWNKYQEYFVRSLSNKSKITIVKPITFDDKLNIDLGLDLKSLENYKIISLFDVTIFRDFLHNTEGFKIQYEVPEIAINFVKDVLDICIEKNIKIIYKSKRIKNNFYLHNAFQSYINKISDKNFLKVNPDVSIDFLIKKSNACISFPFTSSSVIAKLNNIPTCFYDPTSKLVSNKYQTNNIKLIKGKKNLKLWINSLNFKS